MVTDTTITNITPASNTVTAKIIDGASVSSTHICTLNRPQLPTRTREGHIIPGVASHFLLPVINYVMQKVK